MTAGGKGRSLPSHLPSKASHPLPGPRELSLDDSQVTSCLVTLGPPPRRLPPLLEPDPLTRRRAPPRARLQPWSQHTPQAVEVRARHISQPPSRPSKGLFWGKTSATEFLKTNPSTGGEGVDLRYLWLQPRAWKGVVASGACHANLSFQPTNI